MSTNHPVPLEGSSILAGLCSHPVCRWSQLAKTGLQCLYTIGTLSWDTELDSCTKCMGLGRNISLASTPYIDAKLS